VTVTYDAPEFAIPLNPAHPNHGRWKRAVDAALLRGELAYTLLSADLDLRGARVLDAGCGIGGASRALRGHGADVHALDANPERLAALARNAPSIAALRGDLARLPYGDARFDAVVMQDVLEHATDPAAVVAEAARILRPGGVAFVSTPARWALANLVADPHWGLPLLAVLPRRALRAVLRVVRPADAGRRDLARLLSSRTLFSLLRRAGFNVTARSRNVVDLLFSTPEAVVWSDAHLRVVAALRKLRLHRLCRALAALGPGPLAAVTTPAWYLTCRKREP
jgi:SAM-dependent methyltransferase